MLSDELELEGVLKRKKKSTTKIRDLSHKSSLCRRGNEHLSVHLIQASP